MNFESVEPMVVSTLHLLYFSAGSLQCPLPNFLQMVVCHLHIIYRTLK